MYAICIYKHTPMNPCNFVTTNLTSCNGTACLYIESVCFAVGHVMPGPSYRGRDACNCLTPCKPCISQVITDPFLSSNEDTLCPTWSLRDLPLLQLLNCELCQTLSLKQLLELLLCEVIRQAYGLLCLMTSHKGNNLMTHVHFKATGWGVCK